MSVLLKTKSTSYLGFAALISSSFVNSKKSLSICLLSFGVLAACSDTSETTTSPEISTSTETNKPTPFQAQVKDQYTEDLGFLKNHINVIELSDQSSGASLVVVPDWQGRIMTATTGGGESLGWLNTELIKEGIKPEDQREGLTRHIYAFGGADRFWIGPEGGQFSWYFPPNAEFAFENWKVPAFIDTDAWAISAQSDDHVEFSHNQSLKNWSGTEFNLSIKRTVALLDRAKTSSILGLSIPEAVAFVGYESQNNIKNSSDFAWNKDTGMPSVWILGMLNHGPQTTVVIPFNKDTDTHPIVKDDYFGKVPSERLKVNERESALYFSADGSYRSKIGITHERSIGLAGSWDGLNETLTVVQYNQPEGAAEYVNSSWEIQSTPFIGDAINSYNDGPVDGGMLGPFYEIETSSPALNLEPGESYEHNHRTFHFRGDRASLNQIAQAVLGVGLAQIENGLND